VLIMRRRAGERFVIGDNIEIEILEVSGSRVRLGVIAPDSVMIVRKEAQLTRAENVAAASGLDQNSISTLVGKLSR
jgi:carbon storage regulator